MIREDLPNNVPGQGYTGARGRALCAQSWLLEGERERGSSHSFGNPPLGGVA